MSSINENIGILRAILLALLVVAIIGPWTFNLINVPAEYPCSAPFVRLEGDFCGSPVLGITGVFGVIAGMPLIAWEFLTGGMTLADLTSALLSGSFIFLLILPFFTALLLFLGSGSRPRQLFHIGALILVTGLGIFVMSSRNSGLHQMLWGMWLYFGLAFFGLVLEVLAFAQGRRISISASSSTAC